MEYSKFPRIKHFSFSNPTEDDLILKSDIFNDSSYVIASIKFDGENTKGYNKYIHARSIDSNNHESRSLAKQFWYSKSYLLDDNTSICFENLYAKHTIHYKDIESFFYLICVQQNDMILSIPDTQQYSLMLDMPMVTHFYIGNYNIELIKSEFEKYIKNSIDEVEGFVVRSYNQFHIDDFQQNICKYVRPEFKQNLNAINKHWLSSKIIRNELRK